MSRYAPVVPTVFKHKLRKPKGSKPCRKGAVRLNKVTSIQPALCPFARSHDIRLDCRTRSWTAACQENLLGSLRRPACLNPIDTVDLCQQCLQACPRCYLSRLYVLHKLRVCERLVEVWCQHSMSLIPVSRRKAASPQQGLRQCCRAILRGGVDPTKPVCILSIRQLCSPSDDYTYIGRVV